MKNSIKNLETKAVKNIDSVKGGQGGYGNGYNPPAGQGQTQQTQLL